MDRMSEAEQADKADIPREVLEGLRAIRDSAATNMLDRNRVIRLMLRLGIGDGARWLLANEDRYMEALIKMGEMEDD